MSNGNEETSATGSRPNLFTILAGAALLGVLFPFVWQSRSPEQRSPAGAATPRPPSSHGPPATTAEAREERLSRPIREFLTTVGPRPVTEKVPAKPPGLLGQVLADLRPRNDHHQQKADPETVWSRISRLSDCLIFICEDPLDSVGDFAFDTLVDAVQKALGTAGFTLDRYYLPWHHYMTASKAFPTFGTEPSQRFYRTEPGVLLFRRLAEHRPKEECAACAPRPYDLLVVFVCGETPVAGIHKQAFWEACWRVEEILPPDSAVHVVGPRFSGSVLSFAKAVEDCHDSFPWRAFNIISPTMSAVTEQGFKSLLAEPETREAVSFRSMHLHVRIVKDCLLEYVRKQEPGAAIAWITESNTGYGVGAVDEAPKNKSIWDFRLPYQLAQLRAAYSTRDNSSDDRPRLRSSLSRLTIPMETNLTDADAIAPVTPDVTSPVAELCLSSVLEVIIRERIRYVGITTTDPRDRIFLANAIRQRCPNVQLLFLNVDVLYTHPDYAHFMHGTIIGSSYPLYPRAQAWTYSYLDHRYVAFARHTDQAVYNAILASRYTSLVENHKTPPPLELVNYGLPFAASSSGYPAVWINKVGCCDIWPLKVISAVSSARTSKPSMRSRKPSMHSQFFDFVRNALAVFSWHRAGESQDSREIECGSATKNGPSLAPASLTWKLPTAACSNASSGFRKVPGGSSLKLPVSTILLVLSLLVCDFLFWQGFFRGNANGNGEPPELPTNRWPSGWCSWLHLPLASKSSVLLPRLCVIAAGTALGLLSQYVAGAFLTALSPDLFVAWKLLDYCVTWSLACLLVLASGGVACVVALSCMPCSVLKRLRELGIVNDAMTQIVRSWRSWGFAILTGVIAFVVLSVGWSLGGAALVVGALLTISPALCQWLSPKTLDRYTEKPHRGVLYALAVVLSLTVGLVVGFGVSWSVESWPSLTENAQDIDTIAVAQAERVFAFERQVHLMNGLSAVTAVSLLLAAVVVLALSILRSRAGLRRSCNWDPISGQDGHKNDGTLRESKVVTKNDRATRGIEAEILNPLRSCRSWRFAVLVAALVLAWSVLVWQHPPVAFTSSEYRWSGKRMVALVLLLFYFLVYAIVLVHVSGVLGSLVRWTRRAVELPLAAEFDLLSERIKAVFLPLHAGPRPHLRDYIIASDHLLEAEKQTKTCAEARMFCRQKQTLDTLRRRRNRLLLRQEASLDKGEEGVLKDVSELAKHFWEKRCQTWNREAFAGVASRKTECKKQLDRALASCMVLYVRRAYSYCRELVVGLFLSTLLFFLGVSSYPDRQQDYVLTVAALMCMGVSAYGIYALGKMQATELYRRVAESAKRQRFVRWDTARNVLLYGGPILIAVLASIFPGVWRWFLQLVEPCLRLLAGY